jgi:hypothetical protein
MPLEAESLWQIRLWRQFFPVMAKKIGWLDARDYWIVGEGFAKTEKYVEFQKLLQAWAPEVANTVNRAPAGTKYGCRSLGSMFRTKQPKPAANFGFVGLE